MVGSLGPTLQRDGTLGLSAAEIGWAGSAYVAGAVLGALFFGRLADKLGRKPLFLATLSVYLVATLLTAGTWNFWSFAFCRFLTGFGIGGEYAAINSAIDELIPARVRGLVDLAINGSFWLGAAAGAGLSIVLLEPGRLADDVGWRVAFAFGAVLTVAILLVRRHLPESPRWLMTRGRLAEAEAVVARIEEEVEREHGPCAECRNAFSIRLREHVSWREIFTLLVTRYRRRTVLGLVLMGSQAFFYNAIFFTYALVLTSFYGVATSDVGYYIFPFAIGNFLGPLLLGRLFDSAGRRTMIAATYAIAGVGLLASGYAFSIDLARCDDDDVVLVGAVLLRVGGRELGLPHGERDLSARDARGRDLDLLRDRDGHRRVHRARAVRHADRDGKPRRGVRRLRGRRVADGRRRRGRGVARRRCRAQAARDGREAVVRGRR